MESKFDFLKNNVVLVKNDYYKKYFSGVSDIEGYLLYGKEKAFFTDSRYFLRLKELLSNTEITPVLYNGIDCIKKYLKQKGIKKVYIDYDSVTLSELLLEYKKLKVKLKNGTDILKELRAVKTPEELKNIQKACEITEKSFYEILPFIKEGITELEVKNLLEKQYIKNGASGPSFETIVAFNKNSAIPHHKTSETKLAKNSVVLIDTGCVYNGYCSDFTRTFCYGKPSQKFIDAYNAVLNANILAIEKITDGIAGKEADKIARDYLESQGYKDKFTHSLGHGIGLEIHEFPYLSNRGESALKNGMAFTIEPGVYFDEEFGIRIEDTVVLLDGKVKRLYKDEKKLLII